MTSDEIRPASDARIQAWKDLAATGPIMLRADMIDALVARIESDRTTIADLLSALKQFVNGLDTCNCPVPQPLVCRFCMGRVAIAKAETREEA